MMHHREVPRFDLATQKGALIRLIGLGMDAESLFSSELGQRMLKQAEAQTNSALDRLLSVDPADAKAIAAAQFDAAVVVMAIGWLEAVVNEGNNAQQQLHNLMENEG